MLTTVKDITEHVCERMHICAADVLGESRMTQHVRVRHVIMLVADRKLRMASTQIGRRFGRDHSTAQFGVATALQRLKAGDWMTTRAYRLAVRYVAARGAVRPRTAYTVMPIYKGISPSIRSKIAHREAA